MSLLIKTLYLVFIYSKLTLKLGKTFSTLETSLLEKVLILEESSISSSKIVKS